MRPRIKTSRLRVTRQEQARAPVRGLTGFLFPSGFVSQSFEAGFPTYPQGERGTCFLGSFLFQESSVRGLSNESS